MALCFSDKQQFQKQLNALKAAINENKTRNGLSKVTNEEVLAELVDSFFGRMGNFICGIYYSESELKAIKKRSTE